MEQVELNVGGTKITTLKSTLVKLPYFKNYFNSWHKEGKENTEIFLDVDFNIFMHVLNKLRDENYIFPEDGVIITNITNMFDYFGLAVKNNHCDYNTPKYVHVEVCRPNKDSYYPDKIIPYRTHINTDKVEIMDILLQVEKFNSLEFHSESYTIYQILNIENNALLLLFFDLIQEERQYQYYRLKPLYLELLKDVGELRVDFRMDGILYYSYVQK